MLKKIFKWLAIIAGTLFGIVAVTVAVLFFYVGGQLNEIHDLPLSSFTVDDFDVDVAEGERLARLRGCYGGCHGSGSEGSLFFELPDGSQVIAPNLTRIVEAYGDATLERAVRHGIGGNGKSLIGAMPSSMYFHLADEDLADIIAFLRALPEDANDPGERSVGPLFRVMFPVIRSSGFEPIAALDIDHDAERLPKYGSDATVFGRYLAVTTCTECHGRDLGGEEGESIPDLAIARGYSREEFRTLMREGKPIGERELGLMSDVALSRFAYFTDEELDALHEYLLARQPGDI